MSFLDKTKTAAQNFGRAIVDPVLYLAVVGIILAISTICSLNASTELIGKLLSVATNSAVIGNMPLVFCVGICSGLAKKQKSNAAVLALIVYLMFIYVNNCYLTITGQLVADGAAGMGLFATGQTMVLGLQVTDINVFGGVILGCLTGFIYNKLVNVPVPEYVRIYGGPRLVFLAMIPVVFVFSIGVTVVWPPIAQGIHHLSAFINNAGPLGVFVYAFLNRFLIPTGLHHFMWMPFSFTAIGGSLEVAGTLVQGGANIFYAEMPLLANGSLTVVDPSVRFVQFGFAKEFLTLGCVLAMIRTSRPEHRKSVAAMLVPIYIAACLSGITEPLDFIILFASPALWLAKGILTGLGETVLFVLGVRTYNIYGLIELLTVNLPLPWGPTKFPLYIAVGLVFVVITYFVFRFLILRMNIMTPGRALDWGNTAGADPAAKPSRNNYSDMAEIIVRGLGGAANIETVGCCMTRLRVILVDPTKLDEDLIKTVCNRGIVKNSKEVQIIIGMQVQDVLDAVEPLI